MRALVAALLLSAALPAAEKDDVLAAVQRTFDAMEARDARALRAVVLAEAQFFAVAGDGKVRAVSLEQYATRLGEAKEVPLERIWKPRVLISGRLATVWASYDFHRGGAFSHCGVDAIHLLKTQEGWKLSSIAYTMQSKGCAPSPLGPPKK